MNGCMGVVTRSVPTTGRLGLTVPAEVGDLVAGQQVALTLSTAEGTTTITATVLSFDDLERWAELEVSAEDGRCINAALSPHQG